MRILFITATRIGDGVLSSGLLAHLAARYPEARFVVACGPLAAPLFAAVPRLERLIVVEKKPWKRHWLDLWNAVAGTSWDMVVDLRGSGLSYLVRTRTRRVIAPERAGEHAVAHLSRTLAHASPIAPHVFVSEAAAQAGALIVPTLGKTLCIGPTSNSIGKQWPADRFAVLAERLTGAGGPLEEASFLVIGGPGERELARPLLDRLDPARTQAFFGELDLLTAYACLQRTALFVGNDSGLMHLAAAAGVPTLGLFGPSDERRYAPWGPQARVVRGAPLPPDFEKRLDGAARMELMRSLSVDTVEAAARQLLADSGH